MIKVLVDLYKEKKVNVENMVLERSIYIQITWVIGVVDDSKSLLDFVVGRRNTEKYLEVNVFRIKGI